METGDDVIDMDSSNTPSMILMVPVEMRDVDREEMTTVDEFMEKGCGCTLNNGKSCYTAFTRDHISCIRDQCSSFDRSTLSTLLFGHVMATSRASDVARNGRPTKEREKNYTTFMHEGIKVWHT